MIEDFIDYSSKYLRCLTLGTEACPFCRRVREALTELDLSVEVSQPRIVRVVMCFYSIAIRAVLFVSPT